MSLNTRIKNTVFKISEFSDDKTPESAEFAIIRPFWAGLFFQISTVSVAVGTVSATIATVIAVATILSINAPKEVVNNGTNSTLAPSTILTTLKLSSTSTTPTTTTTTTSTTPTTTTTTTSTTPTTTTTSTTIISTTENLIN
jgi:hypothetical protein